MSKKLKPPPPGVTQNELTGTTIGELSGATTRQIQHWTEQGWLKGTKATSATRAPFMYPPVELDVAKVMIFLDRAGFTFEKAALIARTLAEGTDNYVLEGVMGSVTVKFRLAADEPENDTEHSLREAANTVEWMGRLISEAVAELEYIDSFSSVDQGIGRVVDKLRTALNGQ